VRDRYKRATGVTCASEREVWAATFAVVFFKAKYTDKCPGALAASIADQAVYALRAEIKERNRRAR
jgi:hypothetical protein